MKTAMTFLAALPLLALGQDYLAVPVPEIEAYKTRLADVYFPARTDPDERVQLMKNYFGQEFSIVRYPDGTMDYVLIKRQYGHIVFYQVLVTSEPEKK